VWSRTPPRFLDLLSRRDVHATFFMLGSMVAAAPGLAGEIAAAGHEIAVHGWDHRYLTLRGPAAACDDIARARDTIAGATGRAPVFFRPPYGVLSGGALLAARRLALRPLLWACWGREWVTRHDTRSASQPAAVRRPPEAGPATTAVRRGQ
jgi:peptidoglycan/xylan/chitin deacetylase (PgdA/CDA1 family)